MTYQKTAEGEPIRLRNVSVNGASYWLVQIESRSARCWMTVGEHRHRVDAERDAETWMRG